MAVVVLTGHKVPSSTSTTLSPTTTQTTTNQSTTIQNTVTVTTPPPHNYTNGSTQTSSSDVFVNLSQNGKSVQLNKGQHLVVTLDGPYWGPSDSNNTAVLNEIGYKSYDCYFEFGCKNITTIFNATGIGTTAVTDSRAQCGEARACVNQSSNFTLNVSVK